MQSLTLGNGVTETTQWDLTRLQPQQISAASNGVQLLSLQYSFCQSLGSSCSNNNGNLWQQRIVTGAVTRVQTYGYDGFSRLNSTQEMLNQVSQWSQAYIYDAFGIGR